MKKTFLLLSFLLSFVVSAQVQTFNTQVKLNNVPSGSASDSLLVRGSDKLIKFVPKSEFLEGISVVGQDLPSVLIEGNSYEVDGYTIELAPSYISMQGPSGTEGTSLEWNKLAYIGETLGSTVLQFEETTTTGVLTVPNKTGTLATLDDIGVSSLDEVTSEGNETANGISVGGVGINTTTPEAVLDVVSTDSGVLIPRLTTVQRDAIVTPINSMLIFNTDSGFFEYYFDSVWVQVADAGDYISLSGTAEGNPVTGDVEMNGGILKVYDSENDVTGYFQGSIISVDGLGYNFRRRDTTSEFRLLFPNTTSAFLSLDASEVTDGKSILIKNKNGSMVVEEPLNGGIIGDNDYSEDEPSNKLIYAQRQYVDNQFGKLISLTNTEILALTPETGRLYYNTTINEIVYHNGTTWKKITNADM